MPSESTQEAPEETVDVFLDRSYQWRAPGHRTAVSYPASEPGGTTTIPLSMASALANQNLVVLPGTPEAGKTKAHQPALGMDAPDRPFKIEQLRSYLLPPDFPDVETLRGAGIRSIGDVLAYGDLTAIKGIGPKKAIAIRAAAAGMGAREEQDADYRRYLAETTDADREAYWKAYKTEMAELAKYADEAAAAEEENATDGN